MRERNHAAYQVAERLLRHNRADLVLGGKVRPQWIDGGERFWYAVSTPEGNGGGVGSRRRCGGSSRSVPSS